MAAAPLMQLPFCCLAVFFRGDTLVLFEDLGKIAALPEAALHSHHGDCLIGAGKIKGGLLNTVEVYIIHWGLMGQAAENPAEQAG